MATWRVLTWNIHGAARPDLGLLAAVVARAAPDVVALQEVRRAQAAQLAGRLAWNDVWMLKHNSYTPLAWWLAEGLAILSPSLLSDVGRVAISPRVRKRSHRRRVLLVATATRGSDTLRLSNTHLATDDADHRILQARRIAGRIRADAAPTAVVAGDLNARDEVEVLRELAAAGLRDPGGDPTSPAVGPYQRIDYVLVPERAVVGAVDTPDGGQHWHRLSDHLPVLVEFTVEDAAVTVAPRPATG